MSRGHDIVILLGALLVMSMGLAMMSRIHASRYMQSNAVHRNLYFYRLF